MGSIWIDTEKNRNLVENILTYYVPLVDKLHAEPSILESYWPIKA